MRLAIKSVNQTKRQKHGRNKKDLWDKFDDVIASEKKEDSMELLYSKQK